MTIEIRQVGTEALVRYAEIPGRFRVESVLHIEQIDGGLGGLAMTERPLDKPYVKEFDDLEEVDNPTTWPRRFDLTNCGLFLALDSDKPVGGAAVAFRSPQVQMLEGRDDLAVLWDIRVHPDRRCEGIGTKLFQHAVEWTREQNCSPLKIETQDTNVPACKFYAALGCYLGSVVRDAYYGSCCAHETMLLWYLDL